MSEHIMAIAEFKIDANINKEKAFQTRPPNVIDLSSVTIPSNYKKKLVEILSKDISEEEKKALKTKIIKGHFNKFLEHDFKVIYARLTQLLNTQLGPLTQTDQKMIQMKLLEGAGQCVPGFHNRIRELATSFLLPNNLEQLLYKVREDLVKRAAASLGDGTHGHNFSSIIAAESGLGIKPLNKDDEYQAVLPRERVQAVLETIFKLEYRWYNLPLLLQEQVQGVLSVWGYAGEKAEGYELGAYEYFLGYIKKVMPNQQLSYNNVFKLTEDSKIVDINWEQLQSSLLIQCQQQGFIQDEVAVNNFLDLVGAHKYGLISDNDKKLISNSNQHIAALVNSHQENLLSYELTVTKKINIALYEKIEVSRFLNHIKDQLNSQEGWMENICQQNKYTQNYYLSVAIEILQEKSVDEQIAWLLTANDQNIIEHLMQYHPSSLRFINELDVKVMQALFNAKYKYDNSEFNLLMYATRVYPQSVYGLVDALKKCEFQQQEIATLLLQTTDRGFNTLLLALRNHSSIASALSYLLTNLAVEHCVDILTQSTDTGWNALMAAIFYAPEMVDPLLVHIKTFDSKGKMNILMQKNSQDQDILQLAIYFSPHGLKAICSLISQLEIQDKKQLLSRVSPNEWGIITQHFTIKSSEDITSYLNLIDSLPHQLKQKEMNSFIEKLLIQVKSAPEKYTDYLRAAFLYFNEDDSSQLDMSDLKMMENIQSKVITLYQPSKILCMLSCLFGRERPLSNQDRQREEVQAGAALRRLI